MLDKQERAHSHFNYFSGIKLNLDNFKENVKNNPEDERFHHRNDKVKHCLANYGPFIACSIRNDMNMLLWGLEAIPRKINCCDDRGWTALHFAVYYFRHNILKELLKSPYIDIDRTPSFGNKQTALMLAAKIGNIEAVKILNEKDASIGGLDINMIAVEVPKNGYRNVDRLYSKIRDIYMSPKQMQKIKRKIITELDLMIL